MFSHILRYTVPVGFGILCMPGAVVFAKEQEESARKTDLAFLYDNLNNRSRVTRKLRIEEASITDLEWTVAKYRREIVPIKEAVVQYTGQAVNTTKRTACSILDSVKYLQTSPLEVKVATIAGSGFLGMMFAFRKGIFRKLFYGTILSGSAAAVIYPKDAKCIANQTAVLAKQYAIIGYHFVVGAESAKKASGKEKTDSKKA